MSPNRTAAALALALLALPASPPAAPAQNGAGGVDAAGTVGEYRGAAALGLALRRVGVTKRVLMVGAHPDDEYTPLLAHLALEEGADVAYLSLTRGEGGQNGIGPELGEGLGLLRTEELLAARRVDAARQFFTRAYDFGFSKSAEETFRHWPREEVLRDAVWVIRAFRPDVVVTVFSGTPRDGHGQHQVSAMIGREAFEAAGDPARFPEQLRDGVTAWKPAKLYQSLWGGAEGSTLRIEVGGLDPLLGRSPYQLAMASRSRHRSQDMGRPEAAGPRFAYLRRVLPAGGGEERSMWEGVDTTLAFPVPDPAPRGYTSIELAGRAYRGALDGLRRAGDLMSPDSLVRPLAAVVSALAERPGREGNVDPDALVRYAARRNGEARDAEHALALAAGLVLDAVVEDARLVPGQEVGVEVTLWNGGGHAVTVDSLAPVLPAGWTAAAAEPLPSAPLAPGALLTRRFRVRIPADASPTEPYFLRAPREGDLYRWPADRSAHGLPFEPAPVRAAARVRVAGAALPLEADATFRDVDPRQGELRRPVLVVPAVSVLLEPETSILPTGGIAEPRRYRVRLAAEAPGGIAGTLRVEAPAGWRAEPASLPLRLAAGERREVAVSLTPPAGTAPGEYPVSAVFAADDGRRFARGVEIVDYPHVQARPLYHDAASTVRAFDVKVPAGLKVAYVEGAGEEGPGVLAQLGIVPDLLDAQALASADLSRYDVIVAGSRAYEVRADLAANNARLLEYVRRGGTLIVQYNKYELVEGRFTPFPITMARPHGRVIDEASPVRVLDPAHPVFTTPNRIGAGDWEGWVQERGLYFAQTWAPEYTPLLEMGDPGEPPLRGGLLVAKHGEGTYVYTGVAFFRQLPAGVPGAWRLFANLLALGAKR